MSELKPCPFCGSDEILIFSGSNLLWWWCECNNPECLASTNSRSRPTNQEAVTAWNTRATDAELGRLRELLRDIKEWEISRVDREPLFVLPAELRARIQAAIDEARKE